MDLQHANWIAQANEHWKEHRPSLHQSLRRTGTLPKALREAADATARDLETLRSQGFDQSQAWEMVRERYLFPPEEPGASEEAPDSPGYLLAREAMQGLGQIRMPGEPEM